MNMKDSSFKHVDVEVFRVFEEIKSYGFLPFPEDVGCIDMFLSN